MSGEATSIIWLISILTFFEVVQSNSHVFYDLSHAYYQEMPVKESGYPPEISLVEQDEGHGLRAEQYDFCISEKLGTHINAPSTYLKNNQSVDRIPLHFLVHLPTVLIDPEDLEINLEGSGQIRSFALNKTHLKLWERQNGKIPYGSFVILRSGWSQFYDFRDKFFGFFADEERQVFPEFTADAVKWLLDHRQIAGIGTECPEIELTQKGQVKILLAKSGHFSVVQLTNLDKLPRKGSRVTIAPFKLKSGSGGPTRVFAQVDTHKKLHHENNQIDKEQLKKELCPDPQENTFQATRQPQAYSSAMNSRMNPKAVILFIFMVVNINAYQ